MYFWDGKAEFSAVSTPVFRVIWSFRNHSIKLILFSNNANLYIINVFTATFHQFNASLLNKKKIEQCVVCLGLVLEK